jgi:hypothetical protein
MGILSAVVLLFFFCFSMGGLGSVCLFRVKGEELGQG